MMASPPSQLDDRAVQTSDSAEPAPAPAPPSPAPDRRMTFRVAVVLLLLSGAMFGMYKLGRLPRLQAQAKLDQTLHEVQEAPPSVNILQPVVAPGTTELQLPGETAAFYETTIFARVNGYLQDWLHDMGDTVKEGELLATIDTPDLDQQLAEATARAGALAADVHLAETQLDFAKITAERWESAAPNGAVSQQERDEKNAEYKTAQAKLEASRAQLRLGEATVKRLQAEESFKRVVAPFDGVITQRHIDKGSLITAGSTASTTWLFAIAQADRIRVYVKVPQTAAPDTRVGMTGQITSNEFPGQVFTGIVDRTAGAVDPVSRTLKVEVLVPNPKLVLVPGMYVQVGFQMPRAAPPLLIEAGALNLRPEGPTVAVVGKDNCVHFRKIEVARDLGDSVEVAKGLEPHDWIALNISDEITEGERVVPVRLETAPPVAPPHPADAPHPVQAKKTTEKTEKLAQSS